jgi:hypothetical protein
VHPVAGLQPSSVQPLVSSQSTGSLTQAWVVRSQRSFVVHWDVSAHCESKLQQPPIPTCLQPSGATHESAVHASLSLQLGAPPPTQLPPEQ